MKRFLSYCFVLVLAIMTTTPGRSQCLHSEFCEFCAIREVPDSLIVSDPVALFDSLPQPAVNYNNLNLSFSPKVFAGYRKIHGVPEYSKRPLKYNLSVNTPIYDVELAETDFEETGENEMALVEEDVDIQENEVPASADSISTMPVMVLIPDLNPEQLRAEHENSLPDIRTYIRPKWFNDALLLARDQQDLMYGYMIDNPFSIEYAYWDLPEPPVLLEEDRSFLAFLKKQEVPDFNPADAILPEVVLKKKHWLHTVGAQLQFSQAYVSPNWYQGGNNYLSLLFGFNWKVELNQVYHPKLLFQSDLNYKLALSSNPKGYYHPYTVSEDNFQYNLNTGYKAVKDWYYSFNLQFKTQLLNNYEQNSDVRTASFLSPGDLNLGLGMSYKHTNKLNTLSYTLTISPLSYNLKTCISDLVNHETYNIPWDKKTKSEIGSNLEFNMDWKITAYIQYKTRVFMFTDYHYYLADWQNTINFEINKFLSTQIFVHLRYDGSSESYGKWKKFMMREILSFGLSYTFSTKP
ncbi:MAG: DUF3078 domain-containing protein [Muribaculaceae bacterium]|nr:DUF3078 domain-containing protein [Muribaculaceae bacterium]